MFEKAPTNYTVINVTSGGVKELSPFVLGPCKLYGDYTSHNVENAWQFSKVYKEYTAPDGTPSMDYFSWAQEGWSSEWAHRYPMGKGAIPEYSWWDGEKLDYIKARKRVYVPLYAEQVIKTEFYNNLKKAYENGDKFALQDYDAYRYDLRNMSLTDVLNNPKKKMGHAFVLAMLLQEDDALSECELRGS